MFNYQPAYGGYPQPPMYQPPVPDQLAQLRGMQLTPPPQPPMSGGIVWVSGEHEARGYPVAPNNAVAMWDTNAPAVYLKQADPSGKPSFAAYDLVERTAAPRAPQAAPQTQEGIYVTREEFDALAAAVAEIRGKETRAGKKNVKEETENG